MRSLKFPVSIIIILTIGSVVAFAQTTRTVCASGCAYRTVQAAVDAAARGDTISVAAGQTFTENVVLRYKAAGSGYITIQSSAIGSLPAAGRRVKPSDIANMPTIRTANSLPVFRTEISSGNPTHHYKLVGLNITRSSANGQITALVEFGTDGDGGQNALSKVPYDLAIDRCAIRGLTTANTRRGVALNARDVAITDSYIAEIHEDGADSQAICGWNGPGGYLIENNFLQSGGENIMFGGSDPSINGLVPTNITIRHNHVAKNPNWRGMANDWDNKNLLELKNAKQVTIRENIFENNWVEAQAGYAFQLTPRNSDGGSPWSTVEDVTIEWNIIRKTSAGISILPSDTDYPSENAKNITIRQNLVFVGASPYNDGAGTIFQIVDDAVGPSPGVENLVIEHNTGITKGGFAGRFLSMEAGAQISGLECNDNVASSVSQSTAQLVVTHMDNGESALNAVAGVSWNFDRNVLEMSSYSAGIHPSSSFYPRSTAAIGFVSTSSNNFALAAGSTYKGRGANGADPGVNWSELMSRTANVISGVDGSRTF